MSRCLDPWQPPSPSLQRSQGQETFSYIACTELTIYSLLQKKDQMTLPRPSSRPNTAWLFKFSHTVPAVCHVKKDRSAKRNAALIKSEARESLRLTRLVTNWLISVPIINY